MRDRARKGAVSFFVVTLRPETVCSRAAKEVAWRFEMTALRHRVFLCLSLAR